MSTALSQFQKQWHRYCLYLWATKALQAFAVAGVFLAGGLVLSGVELWWPTLLCQICLLGLVCEEWGRIEASPAKARQRIYRKHPQLAEAILAALDFQSKAPASSGTLYFRTRHLQELTTRLAEEPLTQQVPFKRNLVLAGAVMLFLGGVIGSLPHLAQYPWPWLQNQIALEDERSYRILYPAYVRKPPSVQSTLPTTLALPRGSRLEIYFTQSTISEQVKKNFFYQSQTGKQFLHWFSQKDRWVATISPLHSGRLSMKWKSEASEHALAVVPDQPPQITVIWPPHAMIFSNSHLPITFTVTDDYGLRAITLHYEVQDKGKYQETIQSFEGEFREYQETYPWELGATPVRKGDRVSAWLEVSDNDALYGPNVTHSEKFHFTVDSITTYHQTIMARLQKIVAELGQLLAFLDRRLPEETLQSEQTILKALEVLRRDAHYDSLLTDELRQFLFSELQGQILQYQKRRLALSGPPSWAGAVF